MAELAEQYHQLFLIAHLLSIAVGLGAATVADFLFFRFLKDLKITKEESTILSSLSQVIWVALIFIVLSGLALYLSSASAYNQTPKFLVKMIVFAVIIMNGIGLNFLVAPRVEQIFTGQLLQIPRYWRRLAFALGSISITSWYTAAVIGAYRGMPGSFADILKWYLTVLVAAIVASQLAETLFARRKL